ncbi:MAG: hypothetical protein WCF78_00200 [archaeon]
MGFYEKDITKENKKQFIKENRPVIEKLLSDFFSKTILSASKNKVANQLVTAYLENKKGKEFIGVLISPRAISERFISQIPVDLRGNHKKNTNSPIDNKLRNPELNQSKSLTIEDIRHELRKGYNNFTKKQKVMKKLKPINKKIRLK